MSRKSRVIGWWAALAASVVVLLAGEPRYLLLTGMLLFLWTLSFDLDRADGKGSRLPWGWPYHDRWKG